MDIYIAKKGETFASVAKRCGVSPQRLAADNGCSFAAPLAAGQALIVRRVRAAHTVKKGETLAAVAAKYGISVRAVYRMNPHLVGLPRMYTGQTLAVRMTDLPERSLQVLGLTTPVSPVSLHAALPFLTYIAPYAYTAAKNGGLHIPDTAQLFATALDYGVLPLAHLPDGATDNARGLQTAVYAAAQNGAVGAVTARAHPQLTALLQEKQCLCFPLFPSVLHGAADCQSHRAPLPLSLQEALCRAAQNQAEIRFDDTVKQSFFCYKDDNGTHTVWLHDLRSWLPQLQKAANGITVPHVARAVPFLTVMSACCHIVE